LNVNIKEKFWRNYSLYVILELDHEYKERFLENTEKIMDVLAWWER